MPSPISKQIEKYALMLGTFVLFVITYFSYGFYYERTDPQYALAYGEGFWDTAPLYDIFIYHIYLNQIYGRLTEIIPSIDWYGVFMIGFNLIGSILILYAVLKILKRLSLRNYQIGGILIALFILFLMDHIVQIQSQRVPFLLSFGLVFQLLLFDFSKPMSRSKKYALMAAAVLVTFIAWIIKYESLALTLIVTSGIYFLYHDGFKNFKKVTRQYVTLFVPIAIFLGVLLFIMINQSDQNQTCWKMLQSAYTFEDGGYKVQPNLKTAQDSIIYKAFVAGFRTDLENFSPDYFAKQTKPMYHLFENFVTYNTFQEYWSIFKHFITSLKHRVRYIFIGFCVLLFVLYHFFIKKFTANQLLRYTLFHVWFWAWFLSLEFFLVLPKHIAAPMLSFYGFLNVLFLGHFVSQSMKKNTSNSPPLFSKHLTPIFASLFLLSTVQLWTTKLIIVDEYLYTEQMMANIHEELNQNFQNKIIVLNITSTPLVHTRPLQKSDMAYKNTYLIYDGLVIMLDSYKKMLEKKIGSSKFIDFYDYLYKNKENVVFISDDSRRKLFAEYLHILHDRDYDLQLMDVSSDALSQFGDNSLKLRQYRYSVAVEKSPQRDYLLHYYQFKN